MFDSIMLGLGLIVISIFIGFLLGIKYAKAHLKETVTVVDGWKDEDGVFHEIIEEPAPPKLTLVKSSKEQ